MPDSPKSDSTAKEKLALLDVPRLVAWLFIGIGALFAFQMALAISVGWIPPAIVTGVFAIMDIGIGVYFLARGKVY